MDIEVGDVLEWKDFPFPRYHIKEIKTRWLVYCKNAEPYRMTFGQLLSSDILFKNLKSPSSNR